MELGFAANQAARCGRFCALGLGLGLGLELELELGLRLVIARRTLS
jgi:hypothetical protein